MADLLLTSTLAKWTQEDPAEVAADPFAVDLIAKVSQLVCYIGGHDGTKFDDEGEVILEWTLDPGPTLAPTPILMIVLQVCKRSYENPGQVIQEGNIGPIGGDRVADTQALFMDFTEAERRMIATYNVDGDPLPPDGAGEVFVLPTTRGDETTLPQVSRTYVEDNLQINIGPEDSAWPTWDIPLFNPGDPGADENYA